MSHTWSMGKEWTKLVLSQNGSLEIFFENGKREYIRPAEPKQSNL
jgi:hypothetical protein